MLTIPHLPHRDPEWGNHPPVLCKACGGDYTHLMSVEAYPWGKKIAHVITHEGAASIAQADPNSRYTHGGAVHINLFCEHCSAITRRVLYFHKGMTYTWDEVAGHRDGGPETPEPTWPKDL